MVRIRILSEDESGGVTDTIEPYETDELSRLVEENPDPEQVEIIGVNTGDDEEFDEELDAIWGDFVAENTVNYKTMKSTAGPRFSASRVLKEMDPTFYRIARSEWEDERVEMARDELESQVETEEEQSWIDQVFRNW